MKVPQGACERTLFQRFDLDKASSYALPVVTYENFKVLFKSLHF